MASPATLFLDGAAGMGVRLSNPHDYASPLHKYNVTPYATHLSQVLPAPHLAETTRPLQGDASNVLREYP
jgi:hypothetical protein